MMRERRHFSCSNGGHRMRSRGVVGSILCLMVLVLSLAVLAAGPQHASASTTAVGNDANIPKGKTINDDLVLAGGDVTIDGIINGDVTGTASTLKIGGRVQGDVNVAAGTIEIIGTIGQTLRAVGGKTTISGTVGNDVVIVGGKVGVESSGKINGD